MHGLTVLSSFFQFSSFMKVNYINLQMNEVLIGFLFKSYLIDLDLRVVFHGCLYARFC